MRAATAQNINNMKMGPILRHTTLFPPHPGIEFSPWKRVNSANMSLQNLYYEISCYFRNGQNFHISTYFYHFVPLAKFTLGYRLQLMITFLTIFKRYIGIFWKIRKALSNPNLPLKPKMASTSNHHQDLRQTIIVSLSLFHLQEITKTCIFRILTSVKTCNS